MLVDRSKIWAMGYLLRNTSIIVNIHYTKSLLCGCFFTTKLFPRQFSILIFVFLLEQRLYVFPVIKDKISGYKSSVNILMVFTLWIHSWLFPKPRSSLPWKSLHHYPCLLFRNTSSGQRFFFYYEDPVKEWTKTLSINYVKPTDIDSGLHGFFITAILLQKCHSLLNYKWGLV